MCVLVPYKVSTVWSGEEPTAVLRSFIFQLNRQEHGTLPTAESGDKNQIKIQTKKINS